jgi:hypothetical protein
MHKYFLYTLLLFCGFSLAYDIDYYKHNPNKIEAALKECKEGSFEREVSCQDLINVASHMNNLAIELQLDPEAYGLKLLKLEEELAKHVEDNHGLDLKSDAILAINKYKQDIDDRLIIVKWLESPSRG